MACVLVVYRARHSSTSSCKFGLDWILISWSLGNRKGNISRSYASAI